MALPSERIARSAAAQETARRASPAEPPALSRSAERDSAEWDHYRREREQVERRSMLRGLVFLAIVVALFGLVHGVVGGWEQAFPSHWWWRW